MKIIFCGFFLISSSAWAGLGEVVSQETLQQLRQKNFKSNAPDTVASQNSSYTVKETNYGGGTQREYISSSGVVFAVTWSGRAHVVAKDVLGSYNDDFNTARDTRMKIQTRQFTKARTRLQAKDLVYETGGHMGAIKGKAYVPSLLPSGFNLANLL